jgi:hypothetical protein
MIESNTLIHSQHMIVLAIDDRGMCETVLLGLECDEEKVSDVI